MSVKTTIFAASIGQRRGTASSEARITPVEYSVAISSTPRTAMVSWPRPMPAPKMKPTGSATIVASLAGARGPVQCDTDSQLSRAVRPTVMITNSISVQTVDRTDRILVHSASMRRPKPAGPPRRAGAVSRWPDVAMALIGRSRQ